MAPRRAVCALLQLCLESVERLVQEVITIVTPAIVKHHNDCMKNDLENRLELRNLENNEDINTTSEENNNDVKKENLAIEDSFKFQNKFNLAEQNYEDIDKYDVKYDVNYRKDIVKDFVERLRHHIFSHIPFPLIEDVKNKVLIDIMEYESTS